MEIRSLKWINAVIRIEKNNICINQPKEHILLEYFESNWIMAKLGLKNV